MLYASRDRQQITVIDATIRGNPRRQNTKVPFFAFHIKKRQKPIVIENVGKTNTKMSKMLIIRFASTSITDSCSNINVINKLFKGKFALKNSIKQN